MIGHEHNRKGFTGLLMRTPWQIINCGLCLSCNTLFSEAKKIFRKSLPKQTSWRSRFEITVLSVKLGQNLQKSLHRVAIFCLSGTAYENKILQKTTE